MHAATAIVLVATAAANIGIAIPDLARARFVLANSAEVHVPESWLPRLAVLKAAGGVGLLLWFVGVPALPTAAAVGLVCFFVGAITAHVKARVFYNIAFPGAYLALAVASLVLLVLDAHP
jgi:DoxX-like protein